jgi:hypothetical protein
MTANQLAIVIERDEKHPERYRWVLMRSGVVEARALHTYATRREAEAKAVKARTLKTL